MKRIVFAVTIIAALAAVAAAQSKAPKSVIDQLEKMERQAWDAFGRGDGKFFEGFYSSDATQVDPNGIMTRKEAIAAISTKPCELKNYSINNFKVTMLNASTVFVTYAATQDATCGGQKVPEKLVASSVYVKRNGKWQGALHQESYPI
jgi:hypothetical protein